MTHSVAPHLPRERYWNDLKRRDFVYWTVVASFLPGFLLLLVVVNVTRGDAPTGFAASIAGAWTVVFVAASLYRQNFRCPRCRKRFHRRGTTGSRSCAYCDLPVGTRIGGA